MSKPVELPELSPERLNNIKRVFDALQGEGNNNYSYTRVSVEYGGGKVARDLRGLLEMVERELEESGIAHVIVL